MTQQHSNLSGINYLVPNAICKLLASGAIIINLYWSKHNDVQIIGMAVATLFSFIFGYLVIISFNLALAYEIGRRKDSPRDIGIFYQRALIINFIICAFLITPVFYISNKIVLLFAQIDQSLATIIGQYLFQLIPSVYCFAFYDTTQTYLLAQGHFLGPLVINIFGFFCHFYLIGQLGAAWSKNFTDLGHCIGIYIHLSGRKIKLESWIQWTIQCFKGWNKHLQFFQNIGITSYLHCFFLFLFAIMGYGLQRTEQNCHICFISIVQIIFIVNIGLKQGFIIKLGSFIKSNKLKAVRRISVDSLKIFMGVSLFFVFLMFLYVKQICKFFLTSHEQAQTFLNRYWLMIISLLSDSLNISLFTIIKIFNKNYSLLRYQVPFLIIELALAFIFSYKLGLGLRGLWYGWISGSLLNSILYWRILVKGQRLWLEREKNRAILNRREEEDIH